MTDADAIAWDASLDADPGIAEGAAYVGDYGHAPLALSRSLSRSLSGRWSLSRSRSRLTSGSVSGPLPWSMSGSWSVPWSILRLTPRELSRSGADDD